MEFRSITFCAIYGFVLVLVLVPLFLAQGELALGPEGEGGSKNNLRWKNALHLEAGFLSSLKGGDTNFGCWAQALSNGDIPMARSEITDGLV